MKRFIIVVYCWRWSQCSAKTELHPIFHFKECMPTTAVESKNWKKKSQNRKIRNIGKSFFVFYDFLAKIPVLGHILDCFSTLCGMYLMRFFSCPGQLSLTDILIQSLSRFYFTVLRAKLYFTSSSFGFWDIFGILICICDRFQLHRFSGLVTSWRHSICQIVKQYFIRWDIFKTELQVWFEECPFVQDCGRPWELSGCPLLLFLISNDIVTETRLALDCDIQPWDNRWIKNGWGNCLKKLSKHYSGGLRWNFDSGPVGGDGCPLHLPPTLPWTKLCTGPKYQNVQRSHHKVPGTGHCTTVTLREGSGYQIG